MFHTRYIGKTFSNCDMCSRYAGNHTYELNLLLEGLYPKGYKTKLTICELCAKRESGSKRWNKIKRKIKE